MYRYNHYCKQRFASIHRQDVTRDIFQPVFNRFKLEARKATKMFDDGEGGAARLTEAIYIFGLGFVDQFPSVAEEVLSRSAAASSSSSSAGTGEEEGEEGNGIGESQGTQPEGGESNVWDDLLKNLRNAPSEEATALTAEKLQQIFALCPSTFTYSSIVTLLRGAEGPPSTSDVREICSTLRHKTHVR